MASLDLYVAFHIPASDEPWLLADGVAPIPADGVFGWTGRRKNVIDFPSVGRPRFFASGQETIALVDTRWDTVWMAVELTYTEPGDSESS